MTGPGSVTGWIAGLKAGDESAIGHLVGRYFDAVAGQARRCLAGAPRGAADEEDVAVSVFEALCRQARAGRFADLTDRDDLMSLLTALTLHKAVSLRRHETAARRGGGLLTAADVEALASAEPTPDAAVAAADHVRHLLALLDDDLRAVACHRLDGLSVPEIAAATGCALRTVERRLRFVRVLWEATLADEP